MASYTLFYQSQSESNLNNSTVGPLPPHFFHSMYYGNTNNGLNRNIRIPRNGSGITTSTSKNEIRNNDYLIHGYSGPPKNCNVRMSRPATSSLNCHAATAGSGGASLHPDSINDVRKYGMEPGTLVSPGWFVQSNIWLPPLPGVNRRLNFNSIESPHSNPQSTGSDSSSNRERATDLVMEFPMPLITSEDMMFPSVSLSGYTGRHGMTCLANNHCSARYRGLHGCWKRCRFHHRNPSSYAEKVSHRRVNTDDSLSSNDSTDIIPLESSNFEVRPNDDLPRRSGSCPPPLGQDTNTGTNSLHRSSTDTNLSDPQPASTALILAASSDTPLDSPTDLGENGAQAMHGILSYINCSTHLKSTDSSGLTTDCSSLSTGTNMVDAKSNSSDESLEDDNEMAGTEIDDSPDSSPNSSPEITPSTSPSSKFLQSLQSEHFQRSDASRNYNHSYFRKPRRRGRRRPRAPSNPYSQIYERVDAPGIRVIHQDKVYFNRVRDVDWRQTRSQRAGAIVYTIITGELKFCLGIDQNFGNITDFGGHVQSTTDKTAVAGGLREYYEETLGVFGEFTPDQVADCLVAYRHDMMIMFIHLDVDPEAASQAFDKRSLKALELEILELEIRKLIWLTREDLFQLIKNSNVEIDGEIITGYDVVVDFLKQLCLAVGDFTTQL